MARVTSVEVEIAGEAVELRGDRSLYWPYERMLVIADLHVGKTESLRHDGVALPDGILRDDLARLSRAIGESACERVLVLGDLVHDEQGLTPAVRQQVAEWRAGHSARLELVPGNHDVRAGRLPDEWDIALRLPRVVSGALEFTHEPCEGDGYVVCGHVHPAFRVRGAGDGIKVPCFHLSARQLVLPAFSSLTGGAPVRRAPGDRVVAIVDGHVIEVPG